MRSLDLIPTKLACPAGLALALACASAPPPVPPTAVPDASSPATPVAADLPAPIPSPPVRNDPDPTVPAELAALRADLEARRSGHPSRDADPVAPMREHITRQVETQVEQRRAEAIAPPGGSDASALPAKQDPAFEAIAAEIEEDARRREEKAREEEDRFRREYFARLEDAPLENCIPSRDSLAKLGGDFIPYQKLTRRDFRARRKSRSLEGRAVEPGAHVAVTLICVARVQLSELGPNEFEARLTGLHFLSLLDRDQSWWNDRGDHVSEEWTLRHEQGHFDIAEIEARRLTSERDATMRAVSGRGETPIAAVKALQERWSEHFRDARMGFLELSRRYDRETQHGRVLDRQTDWFARTKRGLSDSR